MNNSKEKLNNLKKFLKKEKLSKQYYFNSWKYLGKYLGEIAELNCEYILKKIDNKWELFKIVTFDEKNGKFFGNWMYKIDKEKILNIL